MIKINKLKTLSVAISSLLYFGHSANAQDFDSINELPVIMDDCGETSCVDRRKMSLQQTLAILSSASAAEAGSQNNRANQNKNSSKENGRGIAIGQKNTDTQVVYLNFEQSSPTFQAITSMSGIANTFTSYQYSQEERDAIQANIEGLYEGFDITFTQTMPNEGEFSTLNFECQDEDGICIDFNGGILFGRAQSIDIRNEIRDDSAFVDAGLWQVLVELDPSGAFFSNISGIPVVDGDVQGALSTAIVNQASNTGAHELGHNLGLRHHDSFGAPGDGVTPGTGDFFPVFDGPLAALESFDHTMASGASVGTGFTDSTVDLRFFSERSALKLATNQRARIVQEEDVSGGNKKVKLNKVLAPNTLRGGDNSEGKLELFEARIAGSIDVANEIDNYRFKAKAGQFLSAEFFGFDTPSAELLESADFVIGAVALYYVEENGDLSLVQQNFQNFEGFDAYMVDAPLEKDGDYVLQVSSPDELLLGANVISLDATGNGALRTGDYEVSIYITNGGPGKGVSSVPGA